jgi:hypothetical protein
LDEAELLLASWHRSRSRKPIRRESIVTPIHHAKYYFNSGRLAELSWLLDAAPEPLPNHAEVDILATFDPVMVELDHASNESVTVFRALSEKLLPINFGWGSEHSGHPRVPALGLAWSRDYPSAPHFFP